MLHSSRHLFAGLVIIVAQFAAACSDEAGGNANPQADGGKVRANDGASSTTSSTAASGSKADWSSFRGPTGMGVSGVKGLPTEWSSEKNITWKTPLPGAGASTPIVFGDRIYLTAYTGYFVPGEPGGDLDDLIRHLICLKADDGSELWRKSVKAKQPEEKRIRDHGYAANSVVVDADHIYVFFGKSGVFAFDHKGNQKWRADVGSGTSGWGTAASPVLYKNFVIINASVESNALIALDRKTGDEKWRLGGIKESWNTPVIIKTKDGKEQLVFAKVGKVLCVDPSEGKELWNCDTDIKWYMVPSLVAHDDVVYALGGRSGVAGLAVRMGGTGDVSSTHRLWTSQHGSNVTSPIYHDGRLYWMHESKGIAYCADAKSGDVVYEERINRGGQIYASSLLADGKLYYINRSGRTFVVAAKPKFELIATNDLRDGGQFNASPAVVGKRLLIRSDKYLYCVGK